MIGQDTDHRPWYRQFWPWFLILLPLSTIVAGITTILIAVESPDDLVEDDYYKQGLAINQDLALVERARRQGLAARLALSDSQLSLELRNPQTVAEPIWLRLDLVHPTRSEKDLQLTLARVSPGLYQAPLDTLEQASWHLTLSPPDQAWQLRGRVDAGGIDRLELN